MEVWGKTSHLNDGCRQFINVEIQEIQAHAIGCKFCNTYSHAKKPVFLVITIYIIVVVDSSVYVRVPAEKCDLFNL